MGSPSDNTFDGMDFEYDSRSRSSSKGDIYREGKESLPAAQKWLPGDDEDGEIVPLSDEEYFSEPPGRDIDATPDSEDAGAKDDKLKNDRPTVSHKEEESPKSPGRKLGADDVDPGNTISKDADPGDGDPADRGSEDVDSKNVEIKDTESKDADPVASSNEEPVHGLSENHVDTEMFDADEPLPTKLYRKHKSPPPPPPSPSDPPKRPNYLGSLVIRDSSVTPIEDEISELSDRLKGGLSIDQKPAAKADSGPVRPGKEEAASKTALTSLGSAGKPPSTEGDVEGESGIDEATQLFGNFSIVDEENGQVTRAAAKVNCRRLGIQNVETKKNKTVAKSNPSFPEEHLAFLENHSHTSGSDGGNSSAEKTPQDRPEPDDSRCQAPERPTRGRSLPAQPPPSLRKPRNRADRVRDRCKKNNSTDGQRIVKPVQFKVPAKAKNRIASHKLNERAWLGAVGIQQNHPHPRVGRPEENYRSEEMDVDG